MKWCRKAHSFCINIKWQREKTLFASLSQHTHWLHHLHYKNLLPADSNVPPMPVSYRRMQKSVYGNLFSSFISRMLGGKGRLCVCFPHRQEVMEVSLPYEHHLKAGAKRCDCSERCQNPSEAPDSIYSPCTFYTLHWELYVFQSYKWTTSLDQMDLRDKQKSHVFFYTSSYSFQNIFLE